MLMQFRVSPKTLSECSAEEWQARVDLAAAHRLAYMHGVSEGILNPLTFVVPGRADRYYQIPFGMHWSEVTASSFMEVGIDDGLVKSGAGDVERSCYCIHAPGCPAKSPMMTSTRGPRLIHRKAHASRA
jgi:hypothetical protein